MRFNGTYHVGRVVLNEEEKNESGGSSFERLRYLVEMAAQPHNSDESAGSKTSEESKQIGPKRKKGSRCL